MKKNFRLKKKLSDYNYVTINGQPIEPASGSTGQDEIDSKTIIEHHQYTFSNYDEYGDKVEIAVHGEDLFGYKGEWNVAFPLEKVKGDISVFNPKVKTETVDEIYTFNS